jgi:hypothetical protein
MATRFGEPVRHNEDELLLTGQALFVDDVEPVKPLFAQAIQGALDLTAKHEKLCEIPLSPQRLGS